MTIVEYAIPVISAITKAAAPITGGKICPPVDATASTAPAYSLRYPTFFMSGIVNVPVVTTLATALPLMEPINALDKTDASAGPPRIRPVDAYDISIKNLPEPN